MTEINDCLLIEKPKDFAAVDGCKGGWCVIAQVEGNVITKVVKYLEEFLSNYPQIEMVFIDIPIGLSSQDYERNIDRTLRSKLPGKSSSVFTPPCREALEANDYNEANIINKRITGKGLSIQAYYIGEKIKEIDQLIQSHKFKAVFIESHPELCFKQLNQNQVLRSKKSTQEGINDRIKVINTYKKQYFDLYEQFLNTFKRSTAKKDDILDAISIFCCICEASQLRLLTTSLSMDLKGIKFQLLDVNLT